MAIYVSDPLLSVRIPVTMASRDCSVCCEGFNKSTRKPLACGFCNYESCTSCSKEYLLGTTQDPHCMSCRKLWNREFMDTAFSSTFVNKDYKKHRETILIDRERSLLPATMPYAEGLQKAMKIEKEVNELRDQVKAMGADRRQPMYVIMTANGFDQLEEMCQKELLYNTLKVRIRYLSRMREILLAGGEGGGDRGEARKFMRACPADGCRGFLSSQWKCGLCEIWVCPDCHDIVGKEEPGSSIRDKKAEHMCKAENVESAKLIAKDSRPCPNCASLIFKIEGCDQMFCVQCHTAFSWRTGKIEQGRIHNPHYYEIIRRGGGVVPRAAGDQECGGPPDAVRLTRHVTKVRGASDGTSGIVTAMGSAIRFFNHNVAVELPGLDANPPNNRDLRAKFLIGNIDEDKFKKLLQQREKKYEKKKEVRFTVSMFNTALGDMLQRVMHTKNGAEVDEIVKEMAELRRYTNECLDKIWARYKCKGRKLEEDRWLWIANV